VTVTLSRETATLETTDADTMTLGAAKRIEGRMRQCRRPLKQLLWNRERPPPIVLIAMGLGFISLLLAVAALTNLDPANPPPPDTTTFNIGTAILTWVASALVIAASVILTARRQAIVVPRY
jgi:uncharacterized protein YybS (DUF2232 family)